MHIRFPDSETIIIELDPCDFDNVLFEHEIMVDVYVMNVRYMPKTVRAQTPLILDHINECFMKFHREFPNRLFAAKPEQESPESFYTWNRPCFAWDFFDDMFC
jgi:hypothetical protein